MTFTAGAFCGLAANTCMQISTEAMRVIETTKQHRNNQEKSIPFV